MQIKHKSYNEYKKIQTDLNKKKLHVTWVQLETIEKIHKYCIENAIKVQNILCHGTRNGSEQKYFLKTFGKHCNVLGTEISDTAHKFPYTIQWDFHDLKTEWIGKFDLIYSNSYDHSYNFPLALTTWMKCLSPNGRTILEFTEAHKRATNKADCFGANKKKLTSIIKECGYFVEFFDAKIKSPFCKSTELVIIKKGPKL